MNAPIKGDGLYGSKSKNPWAASDETDNIALYSYRLEFKHPAKQGDAAQCLFLLSYPPSGNVKV
jgi:23S rRNA-/tRNA-specific pseudouridylate synthase